MTNLTEKLLRNRSNRFNFNILFFILLSLLMVLIYTQKPLFTSNQNQNFLHGMAKAGLGSLNEDWLASTKEPTPLFSMLVKWTYQGLKNPAWFYFYYAILMGLYIFSLLGILDEFFHIRESTTVFILTVTIILILHSAAMRFIFNRLLGTNWMFLFDGGAAGQRLLGTVFQPSVFGVFLVVSFYLFIKGQVYWAAILAAAAACIHPTYLFTSALMTIGYSLTIIVGEKNFRKALLSGGLALILVTPILIYIFNNFMGTEGAVKARRILIDIRIPHHTLTSYWLDFTVLFKIIMILFAILLIRKQKKIAIPMSIIFSGALLLSLYQIITNNSFLALVFPWRPTALLVPLSSSILAAGFSTWLCGSIKKERIRSILQISCLIILVILSLTGIWQMNEEFKQYQNSQEAGLYQWVREYSASGDRFLIPINMDTFRTNTLRPIYIDYFAIPYSNSDVIQWYHRVLATNKFHDTGSCLELIYLQHDERLTHVVTAKDRIQPDCQNLKLVYEDDYFLAYQISSS